MARNYANMATAIWRDQDWRMLTANGQRMYLLLFSQPDISAAGVLALTVKRWAATAADTDRHVVVAGLKELQDRRFVVYDTETEELLVRTFVKWDGGYGNPKRRPVIIRAAEEVESDEIRRALAVEFERLGLPTLKVVDRQADSLSAPRSGEAPKGHPEGVPTFDQASIDETLSLQANRLSNSQSDGVSPSNGVVVTKGPYVETTTHNPQTPAPPGTARRRAKRSAARRDADNDPKWREFWEQAYPRREGRIPARDAWLKAAAKADPDVIIAGARAYAARERAKGTPIEKIKMAQGWLNDQRWEDDPNPTAANSADKVAPSSGPIPADERCPTHRGYRKTNCGGCRGDQLAAATTTRSQS
jgi:hypothetical protein